MSLRAIHLLLLFHFVSKVKARRHSTAYVLFLTSIVVVISLFPVLVNSFVSLVSTPVFSLVISCFSGKHPCKKLTLGQLVVLVLRGSLLRFFLALGSFQTNI